MGLSDMDFSNVYSDTPSSSYSPYFSESSWDTKYDSLFDSFSGTDADKSWYSDIWDYTKGFASSQLGSGLIQGAAGAALSTYNANERQELIDKQFNATREDTAKWREDQLAFQREQLALQAEQLGLQQAALDDKINTRRRHNESINTKPNNAKSIKFG
jgi:hypothetical protein